MHEINQSQIIWTYIASNLSLEKQRNSDLNMLMNT